MRLHIPQKRAFTANLIIGASIALFVYYLKETSLLEYLLALTAEFLARACLTLHANRFAYAASPLGLAFDVLALVAAAFLWTYLKNLPVRIAGTLGLAALLVPVAFAVYRAFDVLLASPLVVCGVALAIALEGGWERQVRRLHAAVLDQKTEAEFSILGHLNHNVRPNLQIARSPLVAVLDHLQARGTEREVLGTRLDGSEETVGEALQKALLGLDRIGGILDETRKLVSRQIPREEFREVALVPLLREEIAPLYAGRLRIEVVGPRGLTLRLHRESFLEALHNLVRNALTHAFGGGHPDPCLRFTVSETRSRVVIDYTNNGRPFPENLSAKEFLSCGRKSHDSPGEGLGGAWIGKVVEAHRGIFEIIRDGEPLHFRLSFPKRGT